MASTPTRDLQEEFLAATRKSQETVVRAIKTWVETVRAVTPKLPSAYLPFADRLPSVPFTGRLPKPEDVVAGGYDFAEHLLALQRRFAEELLDVTVPLMSGNGKSHVAPAAKREPKAAAPVAAAPKPVPAPKPAPKLVVAESAPKAPAVAPAAIPEASPKPAPAARAPRSTAETAPKAVATPAPKPTAKPASKPAPKAASKPPAKAPAKPAPKAASKPAAEAPAKPAPKPVDAS